MLMALQCLSWQKEYLQIPLGSPTMTKPRLNGSHTPLNFDLSKLKSAKFLRSFGDREFEGLLSSVLSIYAEDRKINQLQYYLPASPRCLDIHASQARVIGVGGGNGSSKTETVIAEMAALASGVFPDILRESLTPKFRGPINCRIVLESLTTVMHPVMVPKLQWFKWTGIAPAGGEQGHWGWIPKDCLTGGDWQRSWSEKLRTLTVICRDPDDRAKVLGESTIQIMSHDQDAEDFASGDFHFIMLDEPPKYAIYRECQARTMRVDGVIKLAMTWPDDPAIPVDWIFDEIYEVARLGSDIEWYELHTTENPNLNQEAVAAQMSKWDDMTAQVRIYGRPIRFSNLIHPDFTDRNAYWSLKQGKEVIPEMIEDEEEKNLLIKYNHVVAFDDDGTGPIGTGYNPAWPCVFIMDPHPRKPHMFMWVQVDPADDWWVVRDAECNAEVEDVRDLVFAIEKDMGLSVGMRIMDPNMGASPAGRRRDISWQEEFEEVGLYMELADDSAVGRSRINGRLKPDTISRVPRLHFHPRCQATIAQMKRYSWDDYKLSNEKAQKQTPRDKYDDYPTMLKYLGNAEPGFRIMKYGAPVIGHKAKREGAYG
jgi:hypothetical protein